MIQRGMVLLVAAALGSAGGLTGVVLHAADRSKRAEATLRTANGASIGTVEFRRRNGATEVTATLRLPAGLTAMDAFHGFHVHANDNPANGSGCVADPTQPSGTWFTSADGHFSNEAKTHGMHTGDMPSVLVNEDGTATIEFTDSRLDVADLANRAVVLHAGPDNFGNIPMTDYTAKDQAAIEKTDKTGNAGDRVACGVITVR